MDSQSAWLEKLSNFYIGTAVLHALTMVATGGLFIASIFLCRRRSDKARNVLWWLKIALFMFGVFTFIYTVFAAFSVVYLRDFFFNGGTMSIVSTLSWAFQIIAKTLVFTTLSSLGRGILYAREGKRPKMGLPVALVTYALTAINCILAVAYFGVQMFYVFGYDGFDNDIVLHINRLLSVPMIFLFIASVAMLANSGLVLIKVKNKYPTLKTAAIYNIIATFLFFVSSIYEVIMIGLYIPLSELPNMPKSSPEGTVILMFFFSTATAFLPLALIFNLTRTKDKGLWTANANGPPGGAFAPAPAPQPGFQGQPPMQQPGFQPGFGQAPQGWAPQQPGVYYPPQQQQFAPGTAPVQQQFAPGTAPIQQPVPQQGYAQYPAGQTPSPVGPPSPPQGQPHVTTT